MSRKQQPSLFPDSSASAANAAFIQSIEKRIRKPDSVIAPCIKAYKSNFQGQYQPTDLLDNLTSWLINALDETTALIQRVMEERWKDAENKEAKIIKSVGNSLRRSAGTNYQGLVAYALARYLLETNSAWYLQHPVPKELSQALAIIFTADVPVQPEEKEAIAEKDESLEEDEILEKGDGVKLKEAEEAAIVQVQPDVDILLRNTAWIPQANQAEPVVLLSVKTSLVDRAGMAARWKTYFDLATHPCPHEEEEDCVYRRMGIKMENADQYDILHGIVTANIYKINFHDVRYHTGELNTAQTKSNTHMFQLKLTTRNDGIAITPQTWNQFPYIAEVLERRSQQHGLPK